MKAKSTICTVLLAVLLLPILMCCKKEEIKTAPTVTVSAVTNITSNSATSGGAITSDGGVSVTGRGVCWSTGQSPSTTDSKTSDGSGIGSFTSSITGLSPGVTYTLKAYAINEVGTAYSSPTSFTTLALAPVLTTTALSAITSTSASSGGNITSDGGSSVTARGVCWGTAQNPTTANSKTTDGTGTGSFTSSITGLTPGTVYNVRAYATNSAGTAYGSQITFTTSQNLSLATVTTSAVTNISTTTATLNGNVTSDGNAAVTERGTCVSTSPNPTIALNKFSKGTGTGSFSSDITGFTPNTTYYVRAYAINSQGTAYGNEVSFKTNATSSSTFTDYEGNTYSTVTIGTQVWMASNLKTTKYKDGTAIPLVTDATAWYNLTTPAYCWYNNAAINKDTYGALYNWLTVNTGKLCPIGWHVPSDAEWTTLTSFLGGEIVGVLVAGGKLKETGTSHWQSPNSGATNTSGFTAVPGGYRGSGIFINIGLNGYWWSSTEYSTTRALYRFMSYDTTDVTNSDDYKQAGYSVRCIKD